MDLLVPEVISLISKLGAMMVLIKAGFMSLCPPAESGAFMSRTEGCSELAWRQGVARVPEYLNHVVEEI